MIGEEIKLVTTDELINEIKRRHPEGSIIAVQHAKHEIRSSGNDWRIAFGGTMDTTLKLANIAVWMHQKEYMKHLKN